MDDLPCQICVGQHIELRYSKALKLGLLADDHRAGDSSNRLYATPSVPSTPCKNGYPWRFFHFVLG
jgi:hypothetical protein